MATETKAAQTQRVEATLELRSKIKAGDTLYTVLKHVSKSGMYRVIDVYRIVDNVPLRISWSAAKVAGFRYDQKHEGVGASGCGMDMGFHVVYTLSHYLFPDGFDCSVSAEAKCNSADHSNVGYKDGKPPAGTCEDHARNTHGICKDLQCKPWHHKDGGYALAHRWM